MVRKRVLAVDEDWRIRLLLQANLEAEGLDVQVAVNGKHGLQLAFQETPDLVLLGADLPDMETSKFLERLHARVSGQVSVIVISAEPPSRNVEWSHQAVRYLQKPFAVSALLSSVAQALDGGYAGTERL
jgi:DNA-binding response OmpR family regulator